MVREQRRLAAILVADVVGYSVLVGKDEAGTLARLQALRAEAIEPAISKHAGRLFKAVGDGFLIEFASAVQAVTAAQSIQQANTSGLLLRIGIHVGDVVVQDDDLMGDGINIAARIEGVAEPGGIALSRAVQEQIRGKVGVALVDRGEITLKNIEQPVQVFVIAGAKPPAATPAPLAALPDKPSIIVVPFVCPRGTPEQDAFVDGVTESLITDLSRQTRQSGVAVVARTTSLTLKGRASDVRELARTTGVRYALQGSIQFGAQRLRVNVQLISAVDGMHLWADRFDRELGDMLDLEEEIAERTSRAVFVHLRDAEIRRLGGGESGSQGAQAHLLMGRRIFLQALCRSNCEGAIEHYAAAIRLDDRNAMAHALLSIAKITVYAFRWSEDVEAAREAAMRHRDRARSLDPDLPAAQVASAWCLFSERKFAAALAAFERVAQETPLAGGNAFANVANAKLNVGRAAEAAVELQRVIRVTPGDPQIDAWHYCLGYAYTYLGRYAEAAEAFHRSRSLNPQFDISHVLFAAVCVQLGRMEEARDAVRQAQAVQTLWTIRTLKTALHSGIGVGIDEARMTALWDGLQLAGLPE